VKPVLIYSMSVSVDGFVADCEGAFGWTALARSCFGLYQIHRPDPDTGIEETLSVSTWDASRL
jgi:hypothetical protein